MCVWYFFSKIQATRWWRIEHFSYFFFQSTDTSTISVEFSSVSIKKAQYLRGKAHKLPFYLYVNSPASHRDCDAVQDLARSLKAFPERLPYKAPMPPWLSASALPSLGQEDWFSFSLQVKVQSVCPLPTTLRVDNTTTRSTWKTRPGGAFLPPLSFSLG